MCILLLGIIVTLTLRTVFAGSSSKIDNAAQTKFVMSSPHITRIEDMARAEQSQSSWRLVI